MKLFRSVGMALAFALAMTCGQAYAGQVVEPTFTASYLQADQHQMPVAVQAHVEDVAVQSRTGIDARFYLHSGFVIRSAGAVLASVGFGAGKVVLPDCRTV